MERKVLVIDDEGLNRKLIRAFLGRERLEVIEAPDAETGLELARSEHPELILLDVRLPGMSGLEAIRILKAEEATRGIPVLMLSAGSLAEDDRSFRQEGAAGLLLKPFSMVQLLKAVKEALP